MRRNLSPSTNIDSIKKEAKRWLNAVRSADPKAISRLRAAYPQCGEPPCLRDIQHALALEHGASGWKALTSQVASVPAPANVPYSIDPVEHAISPRRSPDAAAWDRILSEAADRKLSAIDAAGHATDDLLRRIAQLDHVTELRLGNSQQVTEAGLNSLAAMPQLRTLELGGNVTGEGLKVLAHLPELRRFQMCWQTGITDAGIAGLSNCEHIEVVDLMGSTVGDGLIAALEGKPHLRMLKTGRHITDAGLKRLRNLPRFAEWHEEPASYSLMSAEAGPTHLVLDGLFTDEGVQTLADLAGLFGLSFFWHSTGITPACLASLAAMPRLGYLGCEGKLCSDEAMKHISALPHLRMLMAQGTVASDDGFTALSRSRTLEYLWGRECPSLTGRGFRALSEMPALKGIAVSCKNVDDAALATLPEFPALREMMPMDVPDEGFRNLGRCTGLEALWCMYCRDTTDAATAHIKNMKRLKTYYAGATKITDRSLEMLAGITSLETISFWKCAGITDAGLKALAHLPNLRSISLDSLEQVSDAGATVFGPSVRVKYTPG
jgi:hypothetical protein